MPHETAAAKSDKCFVKAKLFMSIYLTQLIEILFMLSDDLQIFDELYRRLFTRVFHSSNLVYFVARHGDTFRNVFVAYAFGCTI